MKKIIVMMMLLFMSAPIVICAETRTAPVPPLAKPEKSSVPEEFKAEKVNIQIMSNQNDTDEDECTSGGIDFKPYMKDLQKSIKRNWMPPKDKVSRTVVLIFSIGKQGELLDCKIHTSSRNKASDKAAIDAVKRTAPFKPLPEEYKEEKIDIQFTFDYNVWGQNSSYVNLPKGLLYCRLSDNSPSKLTQSSLQDKAKKKMFESYMKNVTNMLEAIKYEGDKASLVRIKFSINKDGLVKNAKVNASTGNSEFNKYILSQVKDMEFGEIPKELGLEMIPAEYQFDNYTYDLGLAQQLYKSSGSMDIITGSSVVGATSLFGLLMLKLFGI